MSFDTDTGLKQALATVSDYNPLMKDFPINDLLSATELERIRYVLYLENVNKFHSNTLMKIYIIYHFYYHHISFPLSSALKVGNLMP